MDSDAAAAPLTQRVPSADAPALLPWFADGIGPPAIAHADRGVAWRG